MVDRSAVEPSFRKHQREGKRSEQRDEYVDSDDSWPGSTFPLPGDPQPWLLIPDWIAGEASSLFCLIQFNFLLFQT